MTQAKYPTVVEELHEEIERLEAELAALKERLHMQRGNVSRLKRVNDALNAKITALHRRIEDMGLEIADLKDDLNALLKREKELEAENVEHSGKESRREDG